MTDRRTRRDFLARAAAFVAGAVALPLASAAAPTRVAHAHDLSGNAARASELYLAMQKNFYLPDSRLYLETSPRARSRPYAYLWPFYEALAGTIDLYGIEAVRKQDVDDRLIGLRAYWNTKEHGYDSYPVVAPYGTGGDRFFDDNAWVARALVQLVLMGYSTAPVDASVTPLARARDLFTFIKKGWDYTGGQGVIWTQQPASIAGSTDRGTGPTGGFAKLGLHLASPELTGQVNPYRALGHAAYDWVNLNLLNPADNLYWDKFLGDTSTRDTRYWSYTQGVMIGAGVLLARRDPPNAGTYIAQAVRTADAAISHFDRVGWYTQAVIFNSLFLRNLLLLYAENPSDFGRYREAARSFADGVWDNARIHNKRTHLIKFEERTSAYKLREQAAMVQLYACLAWAYDKTPEQLRTLA